MTAIPYRRHALWRWLGAMALLGVLAPGLSAQTAEDLEAKVKSGFLLNFARYVEWPASAFPQPNSPIIIGVLALGQDSLGRNLESTVEGKMVEAHPVQVKRARRISELADCHVIFISAPERDRLKGVLPPVQDKPVLTVSDVEGFTEAGGIILLKKKQGMMRFDINREAAERAGLKISSKLLKLADNQRQ